MAQIWSNQTYSMSNVFADNAMADFIFVWQYITFSNEVQAMAQVRWRKAGVYNTMAERISIPDSLWSGMLEVSMLEDRTTWVLSGGDLVPPVAGSRRYSEIKNVAFPMGKFSDGVWFFQVRFKNVGAEASDWSAWVTHKIEIGPYSDRGVFYTNSNLVIKGPNFASEGVHGTSVAVMSEAGILSADSAEQIFDVWDTNRYTLNSGVVDAVPEFYHNGTKVVRNRRS